MRSKCSHFTLGVWGLRVCSPDVVQPFATGLHLFFFPASPASPASGSVPLPLLHEVPRKFSWILRCSSTCPILPQCVLQMSSRAMDTDRFAVMVCICRDAKFKFSKRAGNRKYVTTGPHVCNMINMLCNMLCNVVEVVTHRPTGSNQPQTNSSDSAGIAL